MEVLMKNHGGHIKRIELYLSFVRVEERGDDFFRASATLKSDCGVFRGHFPGRPILPGAFHVWIVFLLLTEAFGMPLKLTSIHKARFRKLLGPNDVITMQGKLSTGGGSRISAKCKIEKDGQEASRFTMTLNRT